VTLTEYEDEPIPGLPGRLPPGEAILWQGVPDWRILARSAFHVRAVAAYFLFILAIGFTTGSLFGLVMTVLAGIAGTGILTFLAWAYARSTIYTITNRRVVLRFGVALPMCVNLPLRQIATARMNPRSDRSGDIALHMLGQQRAGYLMLWPYVRPWRFASPEPLLRALPEVAPVADILVRAMAEAVPGGRRVAGAGDSPATPALQGLAA
jgi:hypothetical protein